MIGAIEAGGTKFLVAAGDPPQSTIIEIPTTTPAETLRSVIDFLKPYQIEAIGLACFGPIDLNRKSPTYGHITNTPKLAWRQCDIVGQLQRELRVPIAFDTDVNAAALAEQALGAARGLRNLVYFTIGTGIGAGAIIDGHILHGAAHPEMGHIPIRRHPRDPFPGICPSHGDCLEGLASGPSIAARRNTQPQELPADHVAWEIEAYYLAAAALTAAMAYSPEAIVFGGGVMRQSQLLPLIEREFEKLAAGYLPVMPRLLASQIANAGLAGAFLLAEQLNQVQRDKPNQP